MIQEQEKILKEIADLKKEKELLQKEIDADRQRQIERTTEKKKKKKHKKEEEKSAKKVKDNPKQSQEGKNKGTPKLS